MIPKNGLFAVFVLIVCFDRGEYYSAKAFLKIRIQIVDVVVVDIFQDSLSSAGIANRNRSPAAVIRLTRSPWEYPPTALQLRERSYAAEKPST